MPKEPQSNIAKPLKSIVERIEKLEEEKSGIGDDIKDIYLEAKGNCFDRATIKEAIRLRKLDADEREHREFLRDQYLRALNLIRDLV